MDYQRRRGWNVATENRAEPTSLESVIREQFSADRKAARQRAIFLIPVTALGYRYDSDFRYGGVWGGRGDGQGRYDRLSVGERRSGPLFTPRDATDWLVDLQRAACRARGPAARRWFPPIAPVNSGRMTEPYIYWPEWPWEEGGWRRRGKGGGWGGWGGGDLTREAGMITDDDAPERWKRRMGSAFGARQKTVAGRCELVPCECD